MFYYFIILKFKLFDSRVIFKHPFCDSISFLLLWPYLVITFCVRCHPQPFWPMGTGIARGFLAAMDSAWMVKSWAQGKTPLEVLAERWGCSYPPQTRQTNTHTHTHKHVSSLQTHPFISKCFTWECACTWSISPTSLSTNGIRASQ